MGKKGTLAKKQWSGSQGLYDIWIFYIFTSINSMCSASHKTILYSKILFKFSLIINISLSCISTEFSVWSFQSSFTFTFKDSFLFLGVFWSFAISMQTTLKPVHIVKRKIILKTFLLVVYQNHIKEHVIFNEAYFLTKTPPS